VGGGTEGLEREEEMLENKIVLFLVKLFFFLQWKQDPAVQCTFFLPSHPLASRGEGEPRHSPGYPRVGYVIG